MCSAQSFTSSEGRGENLINHHLRRGDSALTAKLHFLKMKTTWSQLRGRIDEVPQLKLNSTYRDGQLCSLFFFFFSQSVKLCQLFYFNFFPYKTEELLDCFTAQLFNWKTCFISTFIPRPVIHFCKSYFKWDMFYILFAMLFINAERGLQ